ncbi:RHS repeat domain-containing protein [Tahibacter sp. UC22_41]|uniref:RHS repeat domain-containing protein n=1 Tax=Tahibacter sp. UC22_41 TaxID=3350178 RepID=UPI0036DEB20A
MRYYHADGLGSTRLLTDDTAAITDHLTYEAFGELDAAASAQTSDNAFMYTGEQFDPNAGFYYLRARYMNPGYGRFTQQDSFPAADLMPMSLNRYSYAFLNPLTIRDPSGNFGIGEIGAAMSVAATLSMGATLGKPGAMGVVEEETDLHYQLLAFGNHPNRNLAPYIKVYGSHVSIDLSIAAIDDDSAADIKAAASVKKSAMEYWSTGEKSNKGKFYSVSTTLSDAGFVEALFGVGVVYVRAETDGECGRFVGMHWVGTTNIGICNEKDDGVVGAHEFGHLIGFSEFHKQGLDEYCEPSSYFPEDIMNCTGRRRVGWQHIKRLSEFYGR